MNKAAVWTGFAASVALSFGIGRLLATDAVELYVQRRPWIISKAAENALPGQVLLLGDGVAEQSGIIEHCGNPVFNAGVSRATLDDLDWYAGRIRSNLEPISALVFFGSEDTIRQTELGDFAYDFRTLIRNISPLPVTVLGVPTFQRSSNGAVLSGETYDEVMRKVTQEAGGTFIAAHSVTISDSVNMSPPAAQHLRSLLNGVCNRR